MSRLPGFTGGYAVARSVNANVERVINLVPEMTTGTAKVPESSYKRPGLHRWLDLGAGPVRALFSQDQRAFAVSGPQFVELLANRTAIVRGSVAMDGNPATICSNGGSDGSGGHQLFVVSGGLGYIFDLVANTFTQITAAGFPVPALMGAFIDGYFVVLKSQSNQFNISKLNDGLLWDALDVAQISQWPGRILSLVISHNEIWPFSSSRVNPWYDSAATFPFQPVQGASIQAGVLAPWSVVGIDNTLYWVGQTDWGGAQVFLADGYSPKRISTFAIETLLQGLPTATNAIAWPCQMGGHSWYVLYLPDNDTSLVYDAASGLWTEWAHWDTTNIAWIPFRGQCHTFAYDTQLVGSRTNGVVYQMSFDFYQDQI